MGTVTATEIVRANRPLVISKKVCALTGNRIVVSRILGEHHTARLLDYQGIDLLFESKKIRQFAMYVKVTGLLPSATAVAERLCFHRRLWFCSQEGVSAPVHAGIHPPGQVHPPVSAADGTHPTGMLSCSLFFCHFVHGWTDLLTRLHLPENITCKGRHVLSQVKGIIAKNYICSSSTYIYRSPQ